MKNAEYIIINAIVTFLSFLPKKTGKNIGIFLGKIWFAFDKKHRLMAIHNLKKIYSDKLSKNQIRQLARNNFIFHAVTFFEIIRLKRLSPKQILSEIESIEGLDNYFKAKNKNRPVFILSAHFGNWELMAVSAPLLLGHPISLIARKLDSDSLDKIIKEIRSKTGNEIIDKKHSATRISKVLRKKATIGILPDQRSMFNVSVIAPFMGHAAKTNRGLALFDLRYGPEIVPIFSYRQKNGKYKIKLLPALKRPVRQNFKQDLKTYTTIYNEVISKEIYKNPDHWFWFHDRWEKKDELFKSKKKKL